MSTRRNGRSPRSAGRRTSSRPRSTSGRAASPGHGPTRPPRNGSCEGPSPVQPTPSTDRACSTASRAAAGASIPVQAELGPSAWQGGRRRLAPPCPWRPGRPRPARLGDRVFLARTIVGRAARRLMRSAAHRPPWRWRQRWWARRRQRSRQEGPTAGTGRPRAQPCADACADPTAGRLAVSRIRGRARLVTCLQASGERGERPRNPRRCALGLPSSAEGRLRDGPWRDPRASRPSS